MNIYCVVWAAETVVVVAATEQDAISLLDWNEYESQITASLIGVCTDDAAKPHIVARERL